MLLAAVLAYRYNHIACAEGLYNLKEKYCVTAEECDTYGDAHHAYKELGMCVKAYW